MSRLTALYKDLLFLHGHVADPALAVSLSTAPTPPRADAAFSRSPVMNFFKSLMYLGGLESVDLRINENGSPYRPYGNRVASEQAFGPAASAQAPRERRQGGRPRVARATAQAAACH